MDVRQVEIDAGEAKLTGDLTLCPGGQGLVIFAHGSGSSRLSPRNVEVARTLNAVGLSTLLFDLLTEAEAADRANVFDIGLLAERLVAATDSVQFIDEAIDLPVGFFGASTGAAAALVAAASLGGNIKAVVSRGGRPDLAAARLQEVRSPTLLIVGGSDHQVLDLNRQVMAEMHCPVELEIVPGATHLFEEPGTLERVSELAVGWFGRYLR